MNKEFLVKMGKQSKQSGVTMIEYALIAALISVVAILALTDAGTQVKTTYETIVSKLTTANTQ